jgi:hypothetical protein
MAELPPVTAFEIRLHKADGKASIIMKVNAFGPYGAGIQASKMMSSEIAYAIVWDGDAEVAIVHRDKPN